MTLLAEVVLLGRVDAVIVFATVEDGVVFGIEFPLQLIVQFCEVVNVIVIGDVMKGCIGIGAAGGTDLDFDNVP